MRIGEQSPGCGEPIDIGCLGLRVPSHASDPVVEIVHGNE